MAQMNSDFKVIDKTIKDLANKSRKVLRSGPPKDEGVAEILFGLIGLRSYFLQMERRDGNS